jgi:hypothetical protein
MVKQLMISGFQEISWDFFSSINSFGPGMLQHVPDSRLAPEFQAGHHLFQFSQRVL